MVLSLTHRADNFMFRFDGFRGRVLAAWNTLSRPGLQLYNMPELAYHRDEP